MCILMAFPVHVFGRSARSSRPGSVRALDGIHHRACTFWFIRHPKPTERSVVSLNDPLQYMDEVELLIKLQSDLHRLLAKPPDLRP
jgi:hypothetical protein